MSIHFAPARTPGRSVLGRIMISAPLRQAANDDTAAPPLSANAMLRSTLRHFNRHGLNAARHACDAAEAAMQAGQIDDCHHWLAVAGTLDRRMAVRFASRLGVGARH